MRENKPSLGHPLGKSKGYGFLSFKNHDEALNCLRKVNNSPKVFGKNNVSMINPWGGLYYLNEEIQISATNHYRQILSIKHHYSFCSGQLCHLV